MRPLLRTQTSVLHVPTQEFGSCQRHSGAAAVTPHWDPTPLARPHSVRRHIQLTQWLKSQCIPHKTSRSSCIIMASNAVKHSEVTKAPSNTLSSGNIATACAALLASCCHVVQIGWFADYALPSAQKALPNVRLHVSYMSMTALNVCTL